MRTVASWFSFENRCLLCGVKFGEGATALHYHLKSHVSAGYLSEDYDQLKPHPYGFPGPIHSTNEESIIAAIVRKHELAVDDLTESQFVSAIRQAIASGDFMRLVQRDGPRQAVTYVPLREVDKWKNLYNQLLFAVASKYEGESRHETALRYIRDRENKTEGPACSSQPSTGSSPSVPSDP